MKNKALPVLLLCLSTAWGATPTTTGTRETIGPMSIQLPGDWKREVAADGTIKFSPAATGNDTSEVQFSSYAADAVAADAVHTGVWAAMLRQLQEPRQEQTGKLERFTWSEVEAFDPTEKKRLWYRLYTTKEGAAHIVTMIAATSAPVFRERIATIDAALRNAQFGTRAAATTTSDIPVVEAHTHVEIRSFTPTSGVLTDHILFFRNGIVTRFGFINGPLQCYAALDVANPQSLGSNYGRWTENKAARTIEVAWQEGPAWQLAREGDRLSLDGKKLLKLRPIDDLKLDGIYVYRPVGDRPSAFQFTAAGRFEAGNLTESMPCPTGAAFVANGTGTYEVRKWTLILRYDNGATQMLPLKIADEETNLERVGKFTVKSYEFAREP